MPALLGGSEWKGLLEDVASALAETGSAGDIRERADALIATIACHSAVRVGHKMTTDEARALLGELERIEFSSNCPHGRPVVLELARVKIEHCFGR